MRSVDGGETWYSIPETYGFVFVDVVHLGGNQLVAWTPDTLRISIDGGDQWSWIPKPEHCDIEELIGRDGLIVLRCLDGRFAHSADQGEHWTLSNVHSGEPRSAVWLGVGHRLLALGVDGRSLFFSDDFGGEWDLLPEPIPIDTKEMKGTESGASVLTADGRIFWSDDGGHTWFPLSTEQARIPDVHQHIPLSNGQYLFIDNTGVWMSAADHAVHPLSRERDVLGVSLRGDGGLLVYTSQATILLPPQSPDR